MRTNDIIFALCRLCGDPFRVRDSWSRVLAGKAQTCGLRCPARRKPCEQCGAIVKVKIGRRFCSNTCKFLGIRVDPLATFWQSVRKSDDCWLWAGQTNADGYGRMRHPSLRHRYVGAHRVAWELAAGPIPGGLMVGHVCDTPGCVRNDDEGVYEVTGILRPRRGHLWLGTQADNMADMSRKGRSARILGAAAVADILASYAPHGRGGLSAGALARKHRTNSGVIARIVKAHRR